MTDSRLPAMLEAVAERQLAPEAALAMLTPEDLAQLLQPAFPPGAAGKQLATGVGRRAGDVAAPLVLSRSVAAQLAAHEEPVPFVYSIPDGDASDFTAIESCAGFFTSNPAPTAWAAVQAVSEGVPCVVGVPCEYGEDPTSVRSLTFPTASGATVQVQAPRRWVRITGPDGTATEIHEGEEVSFSGLTGALYAGRVPVATPPIRRVHELLLAAHLHAARDWGAERAWERLASTPVVREAAAELEEIMTSKLFIGFEMVKRLALDSASLRIYATVHTTAGAAAARILTANLSWAQGPRIEPRADVGFGLVRDERMWRTPEQLDLLRLLVLGPDVLGQAAYEQVAARYLERHRETLWKVLAVGSEAVTVVRTPCMPYRKLFPSAAELERFAQAHGLPGTAAAAAVTRLLEQQDTYHGCRGMRLLCQREDIAELWLTALLQAAAQAADRQVPLRLRILLATVTFPEEIRRFLALFDRVAPAVLGKRLDSVIDGISVMLETTGAYLTIEELVSLSGRTAQVDGGLIGSNDFTAACLNFNREDAARTIIPGYLRAGILAASPFERLEPSVVGKAILSALRRAHRAARRQARPLLWGLGGELAGDWDSAQWLVTHAAPLGLRYLTTAPEHMLTAAVAAAQAELALEEIGLAAS